MDSRTRRRWKQAVLPARRRLSPLLLALVALFVVVVGLVLAWRADNQRPKERTPQVMGGPALAVDQQEIDFGRVPLDKMVKASFKLSNKGSQPLRLRGEPQVEVLKGC